MAAYLIVDIDVKDPAEYQKYMQGVPRLIQKHGGTYLVRGGGFEILEGTWKPNRLALFRFPDVAAVRALLDDPEYRPLQAIRHRSANTNMVVVQGVETQ